MKIIGAGYAGLIAGYAFPDARIEEIAPQPRAAHRAVLRFRGDFVSRITGIEFRPVTVRKGIWAYGRFVAPSIDVCNAYAIKGTGALVDRSIWNLDPVKRWIAPENLHERMVGALENRISWGVDAWENLLPGEQCVSTAPMPVALQRLSAFGGELALIAPDDSEFRRSAIHVERYRLRNADVFQTIYFPSLDTPMYRASITGDLLIIEYTACPSNSELWLGNVLRAFGVHQDSIDRVDVGDQRYGKILPMRDGSLRKALIYTMTRDRGVYSLGRFATWRNILLDDLEHDITVIRRMLQSDSHYQRHLINATR